MFMDDHSQRYSRQIILPEVGVTGQYNLANGRVLIVGAGGLGSPAALYLAALGVGTGEHGVLRIVDPDVVELTNLHRQLLHGDADIGASKVASAKQSLRAVNGACQVEAIHQAADADSLAEWLQDIAVVVDASDNFATRFAVNQACFSAHVDLVSGAAIRWQGQLVNFLFSQQQHRHACYQCLYSADDLTADNCSTAGIMPPVAGMVGVGQALAAAKLLLQQPLCTPQHAQLQCYDALQNHWRNVQISGDPTCPVCAIQSI